jgi:hypothetical protein
MYPVKIEYLSSEGIHHAEKEAMEQMRTVFNALAFSQRWHGCRAVLVKSPIREKTDAGT